MREPPYRATRLLESAISIVRCCCTACAGSARRIGLPTTQEEPSDHHHLISAPRSLPILHGNTVTNGDTGVRTKTFTRSFIQSRPVRKFALTHIVSCKFYHGKQQRDERVAHHRNPRATRCVQATRLEPILSLCTVVQQNGRRAAAVAETRRQFIFSSKDLKLNPQEETRVKARARIGN